MMGLFLDLLQADVNTCRHKFGNVVTLYGQKPPGVSAGLHVAGSCLAH